MNNVTLMGRLARETDLRYTQSMLAVCRTAIAVPRPIAKEKITEHTQTADFIQITLFGKNAENFHKYMRKGKRVAVEGRIQTGSYVNNKGETVYTTDVVVDKFHFADVKDTTVDTETGEIVESNLPID